MNNQNYLEAVETVLAWDLPDEVLAATINDQFRLMDGFDAENIWGSGQDIFTVYQH